MKIVRNFVATIDLESGPAGGGVEHAEADPGLQHRGQHLAPLAARHRAEHRPGAGGRAGHRAALTVLAAHRARHPHTVLAVLAVLAVTAPLVLNIVTRKTLPPSLPAPSWMVTGACAGWLVGGGVHSLGRHWPPTWALVPLATLTTGRGAGHGLGLGRGSRTWVLRDFDDANVSLFLSRGVETGSHLAAAV